MLSLLKYYLQISLFLIISSAYAQNLSISPEKLELGEFPAKNTITTSLDILNKSSSSVKIISVRNTCSCISTKLDSMEVPAAGSLKISITVLPEEISGAFNKTIYIETDLKDERFLSFSISGNSIPVARLEPDSNIALGFIPLNSEISGSIKIIPTAENLKLGSPLLKGNLEAKELSVNQHDKIYLLKYTLKGNSKAESIDSEIQIPVLNPEGWKALSIKFYGHLGASISPLPERLDVIKDPYPHEYDLKLKFGGLAAPLAEKLSYKLPKGVKIKSIKSSTNMLILSIIVTASELDINKRSILFEYPAATQAKVELK